MSPTLNDDYYNLGTFHRSISATNDAAQTWFDRGLIWSYGFNHEESAECFEKSISSDPTCTMAYWGLAYSLGPNYNKPWEFFDEHERDTTVNRANRAVMQAKERVAAATPVEQALIAALQFRYPQQHAAKDCSVWNVQYADAMRLVYQDFPEDLDVATLYADALMNLTPWALWDLRTGQAAKGARTMEAKAVLERALAQEGGQDHPGLLHLYIHLIEMSSAPEIAMPLADRLRGLIPDAGHLNHMPTHLDVLCGEYHRAMASNLDAIQADEKFVVRAGAMNFYTLYRCHNYHFCIYAAMFAGQLKTALDTVTQLEASISSSLLRTESPPMADWLEGFLSMRIHVLIRFGRWDDLLNLPFAEDHQLYCVTTAMTHYGKGIAYAVTRQIGQAENQRTLFRDALHHVPQSRTLFNNTCVDILAIASSMLDGEMEYRRGNFDAAFDHLRQSITLCDALPYDEPWGWMQPPRHAYGALLLEQGRVEEAAQMYSADLGVDDTLPRAHRHPKNVWALHGYHECLLKLGRSSEAKGVNEALTLAAADADVPIVSSCFCRLKNMETAHESDSQT
jgi:tetratricopeptide (TPR) repeat protein